MGTSSQFVLPGLIWSQARVELLLRSQYSQFKRQTGKLSMKPHVAMPTHSVHTQVHILILIGVCVCAHTRECIMHACMSFSILSTYSLQVLGFQP